MSKKERELDYEDEDRKPRKRGGFFGKILALILGILLGIILTIGGIAGAGYWMVSQDLGKTVKTADKYIDADLYGLIFGKTNEDGTTSPGILDTSYAEKKATELINDITDAASKLTGANGTLESLNKISPQVGNAIDKLLDKVDGFAISLDKETIMSTPLKSLTPYIESTLKEAPLGDVLSSLDDAPLSSLLMAISYGEEGVAYDLDTNGEVVMREGYEKTAFNDLLTQEKTEELFNNIAVASILTIDTNDSTMMALAYGSANRYTVGQNDKVTMNQISYTLENKGDGLKLYDDKDEAVSCISYEIKGDVATIEVSEGEFEYVKIAKNGVGLVYSDAECSVPALYPKTMIGDLQEDSMAIVDNLYLKDALGITPQSHNVLISLAYGTRDVDYEIVGSGLTATIKPINTPRTIGQLRKNSESLINGIALSDIIDDTGDAFVRYLLYGRENVHYSIDPVTKEIKDMLQKRIAILGDKVYNEYGEALTNGSLDTAAKTYTDKDGNVYNYAESGLGTLTTEDETEATIYYLTDGNGKPVKYTKTTLGDMTGTDNALSKLTGRITIGEILGDQASGNKFLKHLKDVAIDDISTEIDKLTLCQVFDTDVFKTDKNGNFLDKDGNVTTNSDEYVLNGTWWYLLHNAENCPSSDHTTCTHYTDYTVKELSALMDNMTDNIHLSTLNKLADDGMLNFGSGMLESKIFTKVTVSSEQKYDIWVRVPDENGNFPERPNKTAAEAFEGKETIGELTVEEVIEYAEGLISVIEQINSVGELVS